jgi:hypothetical protein
MFFNARVAIDQGGCGGIGCDYGGLAWEMISICARETTLGHVIMWAYIIALIGWCIMGYMAKDRTCSPSSQDDSYP